MTYHPSVFPADGLRAFLLEPECVKMKRRQRSLNLSVISGGLQRAYDFGLRALKMRL